jgi:hypothetical protein
VLKEALRSGYSAIYTYTTFGLLRALAIRHRSVLAPQTSWVGIQKQLRRRTAGAFKWGACYLMNGCLARLTVSLKLVSDRKIQLNCSVGSSRA